ncbi:MAG: hypothetical protein WCK51_03590 [Armatimonadota bacterium]
MLVALACAAACPAEIYSAKVLRVEGGLMTFQANGTELQAKIEPKTHFWRRRSQVDAFKFNPGDDVTVNVRTNEKGTFLREVSDSESARWLSFIRKGIMLGTLKGGDKDGIFVEFADGSRYKYRLTEKAAIIIGGNPGKTADLKTGMAVFIKGRTTSTLDTSIATLSDTPLKTEPPKNDDQGTIVGELQEFEPEKRVLTVKNGDQETRIVLDKSSQGDMAKLTSKAFVWLVVERTDSGLLRAIEFHALSSRNR